MTMALQIRRNNICKTKNNRNSWVGTWNKWNDKFIKRLNSKFKIPEEKKMQQICSLIDMINLKNMEKNTAEKLTELVYQHTCKGRHRRRERERGRKMFEKNNSWKCLRFVY